MSLTSRLRPRLVVEAVLAASALVVFVLLAQAFVRGGQVVAFDDDVSRWVADSVPGGVEWVARLFTWLGGGCGDGGRHRRGGDRPLACVASRRRGVRRGSP